MEFKEIKPQNKMAGINPDYDNIGKAFTQQYYAMFDNPATRAQLVSLYNVSMTLIFDLSPRFLNFYGFGKSGLISESYLPWSYLQKMCQITILNFLNLG